VILVVVMISVTLADNSILSLKEIKQAFFDSWATVAAFNPFPQPKGDFIFEVPDLYNAQYIWWGLF